MGQIAFIPASTEQAKALRSGADPGLRRGCSVTTALLRALEPKTTPEEAEFAALNNAGVLALLVSSEPRRLVLAAEVESEQITATEDAAGEVSALVAFLGAGAGPVSRGAGGGRSGEESAAGSGGVCRRGHIGGSPSAARNRRIAGGLRSAVVRTR